MRDFPDACVDLVFTSPPYADRRSHTYGGLPEEEYVDWFLPRAEQIKRVLKPTGSFVLNIKEHADKGQKVLYVYELVIALVRKTGFMFVDDFVWHKEATFRTKHSNRFTDSWEHLYHFGVENKRKMNKDRVKAPSKMTIDRLRHEMRRKKSETTKTYTKSGFTTNRGIFGENFLKDKLIYPDNVLKLPSVNRNTGHSAPFPPKLPEFFIKLFTDEGDLVLDPFAGTGTTCRVARNLRRRWCGIEINAETPVDMSEKGTRQFIGKTPEDIKGFIANQTDLF